MTGATRSGARASDVSNGVPQPPTAGGVGAAVARSLLLAATSAPFVVAADFWASRPAPGAPAAAAEGAVVGLVALSSGVVLLTAAFAGLLQAPALAVGLRVARRASAARWQRLVFGASVVVPLLLALGSFLSRGVARVELPSVRVAVLLTGLVAGVPAALAVGWAAAAGAATLLRRGPRWGRLMWALPVVATAGSLWAFLGLWRRLALAAPTVVGAPALATFLLVEAGVLLAAALFPAIGRAVERLVARRSVRVALFALPALAFAVAQGAALDRAAVDATFDRNGAAGQILAALHRTLDFDGDGVASLLGGHDCDDFDGQRSPTAVDLPDNGVDEDCTGADATQASAGGPGADGERKPVVYVRSPDQHKRYNVLVLCFEAVRADHVSAYGYGRETTPRFDALARESWLFENAIAASSTTRESLPALFTGRYPSGIRWGAELGRGQVYPIAPEQKILPDHLKAAGYWTGALISKWILDYLPSFDRSYDAFELPGGESRYVRFGQYATELFTHRAVQIMASRPKDEPFFLYVHLGPPHSPYVKHEGVPLFGSRKVDLYDHEIRKTDALLGELLDFLRHDKRWDDTILVVFGDHGEEFREHGGEYHSRTVHAESVHVPLLIRVPGETPARVADRVSLVDVLPTLFDVLGLRPEGADPQGVSLLQYVTEGWPRPERPIFSEIMVNHLGPLKFRKAVYLGDDKLMWEVRKQKVTLYDVAKDPGEKTPVEDPARAAALLEILKAHAAQGPLR